MRALLFRDGSHVVAQCLEHDIGTQAADAQSALDRLDMTIAAEAELGGGALEHIVPAPGEFHAMWDAAAPLVPYRRWYGPEVV